MPPAASDLILTCPRELPFDIIPPVELSLRRAFVPVFGEPENSFFSLLISGANVALICRGIQPGHQLIPFEEGETMRFGYFSRRTILRSALTAIIAILIPALAMAQGNGGGKNGGGKNGGGGDEEPSFPTFPIHPDLKYQVTLINPPTGYLSSAYAHAFNDNGCAIGNYEHIEDGIQTTQSWFYDPILSANQAIDLRTLIAAQLPDGAEVLARGINDLGMVVGGYIYANGEIDGFGSTVYRCIGASAHRPKLELCR